MVNNPKKLEGLSDSELAELRELQQSLDAANRSSVAWNLARIGAENRVFCSSWPQYSHFSSTSSKLSDFVM
ncbi:MAG: hypothetical protein OXH31_01770 [Gammaproteobacteria bacterium]|nr:hypothetical protein [Gammaproteobacteria bacterium]